MSLVLRQEKASALTNEELDSNFVFLDESINLLREDLTTVTDTTIAELEEDLLDQIALKQNGNLKLTSLAAATTSGLLSLNGDVVASRSITAGSVGINITNGDGAAGNPVIDIGADVLTTSNIKSISNKTISGNNNTISSISLTQSVVGSLPIANGGTAATSASGARATLGVLASPTGNGIVVKTSTDSSSIRQIQVSGIGLSISASDGVMGNPTISSSATALNIPSTPVARDASGNFVASTITANIVGNVSGNAGTVTNGIYTNQTYSNPTWIGSIAGTKVSGVPNSSLQNSSITINGTAVSLGGSLDLNITGSSNNTPGTYVVRDSSGNFVAGTITATLNGNATSSTSSNVAIAAQRLQTARTINGVSFDGTANITIVDNTKLPATGGVINGTLMAGFLEKVGTPTTTSTSFTPNWTESQVIRVTANQSFTLNAPSNLPEGGSMTIIITQDGTGGRVMTPAVSYKFAGGFKTLSLQANAVDMLNIFRVGNLYLTTLTTGYV